MHYDPHTDWGISYSDQFLLAFDIAFYGWVGAELW
jgi:hypothetical protein